MNLLHLLIVSDCVNNGFVLKSHGNAGHKAGATVLTGFERYIDELLTHGVSNSNVCFERIKELGYDRVCGDASNMKNIGLLMRTMKFEDSRKNFRVTMQFTLEDGEWKVSNLSDIYNAIFGFQDLNISFPNRVRNAAVGGECYYTESMIDDEIPYYVNTSVIDMDLQLDPEISNVNCSGVYYTVTFQNEIVYTSDPGTLVGVYGENQEPDYTRDGYFKTGQYTIAFYVEDDYLLYEDTATVVWVDS